MKFIEMPKELQTKSIETLSLNYGMPEQIIEKDWWVSTVMRALFALPYANQMSFKGLCIATHKPLIKKWPPYNTRCAITPNDCVSSSIDFAFVPSKSFRS